MTPNCMTSFSRSSRETSSAQSSLQLSNFLWHASSPPIAIITSSNDVFFTDNLVERCDYLVWIEWIRIYRTEPSMRYCTRETKWGGKPGNCSGQLESTRMCVQSFPEGS